MAKKASKEDAHYQSFPRGIQCCARCTMFRPPHDCTAVEGDVSRDGWCKFFERRKP